ncbi:hypothetical protein ES702_04503 [subsurface metagenome]
MNESIIQKGLRDTQELVDQREVIIDLATARDKDFIKGFRQNDFIEIDSITSGASAQMRFNSPSNPSYEANKYRRFRASKEIPFKKLYITNTAQAGCTLILKCGGDKSMVAERESAISEIVNPVALKDSAGTTIDPQSEATTPMIYNVEMTDADTEYSQALPAGTKRFCIQMRENDTAFRIAYETGKVAAPTEPYYTIQSGKENYEDNLKLAATTIYFGCGAAGKNIEITAWT